MPTNNLIEKARRLERRTGNRYGSDWGDAAEVAAMAVRAVELLRGEHRHSDIGHREPTELCPTCDFLKEIGANDAD